MGDHIDDYFDIIVKYCCFASIGNLPKLSQADLVVSLKEDIDQKKLPSFQQERFITHKNILRDCKGYCCGLVFAYLKMAISKRDKRWYARLALVLMLGVIGFNLYYAILQIIFEKWCYTGHKIRSMHVLEMVLQILMIVNYRILLAVMSICGCEARFRVKGLSDSTKKKLLIIGESLYSSMSALVTVSMATSLTRIDLSEKLDQKEWCSIVLALALKILQWSMTLPEYFQERHFVFFPLTKALRLHKIDVHPILNFLNLCAIFYVVLKIDKVKAMGLCEFFSFVSLLVQLWLFCLSMMYKKKKPKREDSDDEMEVVPLLDVPLEDMPGSPKSSASGEDSPSSESDLIADRKERRTQKMILSDQDAKDYSVHDPNFDFDANCENLSVALATTQLFLFILILRTQVTNPDFKVFLTDFTHCPNPCQGDTQCDPLHGLWSRIAATFTSGEVNITAH